MIIITSFLLYKNKSLRFFRLILFVYRYTIHNMIAINWYSMFTQRLFQRGSLVAAQRKYETLNRFQYNGRRSIWHSRVIYLYNSFEYPSPIVRSSSSPTSMNVHDFVCAIFARLLFYDALILYLHLCAYISCVCV